ncbi:MAG: VapC toxin family PIN domain ribonuclease [Sphingomonadales bacterium]|nr:VapC toxin family PIN domain ribonuclease [Sphingomonadales bacterium]MDE2171111.1 VapC toxin family PIN domain ribonuclease [Sphingomonadales bacterium]
MNLIDAPVVFALRLVASGRAEAGLTRWVRSAARESLFISALSLLELETLAAAAAREDKAAGLRWRKWLDEHVGGAFDGRILPVDTAIVRRAAALTFADQRDALIAATALENAMTLVTFRPVAFKSGKVRTFDPTGYEPGTTTDDWREAARATPVWIKNLFVRT